MAGFAQGGEVISAVLELRNEGLTDTLIMEELTRQGYAPEEVNGAIAQTDTGSEGSDMGSRTGEMRNSPRAAPSADEGNIYERIEEIAESMIDEKWDELIAEVKKIVEWKEKIEGQQAKISSDLEKLKEDFKTLHQGVLGKLEDYDGRMQDVGTELKAVGRVFKDVIPQFVENVKELSSITGKVKEKKK